MTESNEDFYKRVTAVCEAATEGPWDVYSAYGRSDNVGAKAGHVATCEQEEDAPFIALARTALPEALKRLAHADRVIVEHINALLEKQAECDHLRAEVAAWEATGKNLGFVKGARRK